MSSTWQGLDTVLSMAERKALFLQESLSMSRYDVVPKSGSLGQSGRSSLSSMMTHSEFPVSGSSLSWKSRWEESELMSRGKCSLK